jgi:hypothetical protein
MRLVLRRLWTLGGLAGLSALGAAGLGLLAYGQAEANAECLNLAVCERDRPGLTDPAAPCTNLGCGELDPWVFVIPALTLAIVALVAIVFLLRRRRGGGRVKLGEAQ